MRRFPLLYLLVGTLLGGCALFNRLDVKSLATSAQKPGNVAVYLSVDNGHAPMTGLAETNFHIYENGQLVDAAQNGQTLLDREAAAVHRALLLVDMSGPPGDTTNRDMVARAAADFVENVRRTQAVTVYAFDGSPGIKLAGEFPRGDGDSAVAGLAAFTPKDPSRDLRGAVLAALDQLDARLMTVKKPVRVGTLVVFTRGPDLAGRVPVEKLKDALEKTPHQVYAIGVGEDQGDFRLADIGRAGLVRAPSLDAIGPTFSDAGTMVSTAYDRYYLLAYCSPARAGTRALRVEVVTTDKDGNELKGSVESEFDATGFGPGCVAKAPPQFVIAASPASAEPAPEAPPPEAVKAKPAVKRGGGKKPAGKPASPDKDKPPPPEADKGDSIVPPPSAPGYAPTPP